MKNITYWLLTGILVFNMTSSLSYSAEDWKGSPDQSQLDFGGLAGLGIVTGVAGFVLAGTVSKKIMDHGFIPDINNSVSVELQAGPIFVTGNTPIFYSGLMRWDFKKNADLGFYAIGGVGGFTSGVGFASAATIFPRFGAGMIWDVFKGPVLVRFEISHEMTALGVVVPLFY